MDQAGSADVFDALDQGDMDAACDEVLGLLVKSKEYADRNYDERAEEIGPYDRAFLVNQEMRVTTRLASALACLMAWRAQGDDDILEDELVANCDPFADAECCMQTCGQSDERLSDELRELLTRSYDLYVRVVQIDNAARFSGAGAN